MDGRRRIGAGLLAVGVALTLVGGTGYVANRPPVVSSSPFPTASLNETESPGVTPSTAPTPDVTLATSPTPAPTAAPDPAALITDFLDALVGAVRAGTAADLGSALHPAVIDRYGAEACAQELATRTADPAFAVEVIDVLDPAPWDYVTDDLTTIVPDVTTVRAAVTARGETADRDLHVAIVDGVVRWFTDCGDPPNPTGSPAP